MERYAMKHPEAPFLVLIVFCCMFISSAWAGDTTLAFSSVAQKAKAIVEAAHVFVLEHSDDMAAFQKALQNDPAFSDHEKKLYIFMHCYNKEQQEAVCCGQGIRPELVGKNMWFLRTPNGRLIFHEFANMIEKNGEGWIEYDWLNPYRLKIQTKMSFLKGITLRNGQKAWVGCGFWKSDFLRN